MDEEKAIAEEEAKDWEGDDEKTPTKSAIRAWLMSAIAVLGVIFMFIAAQIGGGLLMILLGEYNLGLAAKERKKISKIKEMPTTKIRDAKEGPIELSGIVREVKNLQSPITITDCVSYKFTILRYESRGRSGSWVPLKTEKKREVFILDDESGRVQIDPTNAKIEANETFNFKMGLFKKIPPELAEIILKNKLKVDGFLSHSYQFIEEAIRPGDTVFLTGGRAVKNAGAKKEGYETDKNLTIKKDKGEFVITTKSEAGLVLTHSSKSLFFSITGTLMIILGISTLLISIVLAAIKKAGI